VNCSRGELGGSQAVGRQNTVATSSRGRRRIFTINNVGSNGR